MVIVNAGPAPARAWLLAVSCYQCGRRLADLPEGVAYVTFEADGPEVTCVECTEGARPELSVVPGDGGAVRPAHDGTQLALWPARLTVIQR